MANLEDRIKLLLEITHKEEKRRLCSYVISSGLNSSNLPKSFIEYFNDHLLDSVYDEIDEMLLPTYLENYDIDTINAAIDFFTSPHGKLYMEKNKIVAAQSILMAPMMGAKIMSALEDGYQKWKNKKLCTD